jgi:hypothetical protein
MSVRETIAEVEAILPGKAAPDGELDPRWQGIMRIEDFIPEEPDAVWAFILRWGCHEDERPSHGGSNAAAGTPVGVPFRGVLLRRSRQR